jgi:plastocyanin
MVCFMFTPSALTAKAGTVTFFLKNADPETGICQRGHNLVIGTPDGYALASSDYVMNGKSSVFVVRGLAAGSYAIWCSVDSHRQQGQIGTLTVTS